MVFNVSFIYFMQQKQEEKEEALNVTKSDSEIPKFNLEKARHEVKKLGISGFEKTKKEIATTDLLIKLGAKVSSVNVVASNLNYSYNN